MVAPARPFDAAILTGGRSRRMGRDKALLELDGRTLVELAARAAADAGAEDIVTVGGDRSALRALGFTWVPDRWPGEGPLGGIITALAATTADRVIVLACDHVAASAEAVTAVVDSLGDRHDVAIPVVGGRDQTMHAVWHRRSVGVLEANFDDGARSVRDGLVGLAVARVPITETRWFTDADTPAQLLAAQRTRYHERSSEELQVTVNEIDVETLDALHPTEIQLIDVREADEYDEARVRGAVHVPLATVPGVVDTLDRDATVYVICASGGRSMRAAEFLVDAGFDAVNVAGGTKGWIASGRPVDSGPATA